MKNNICKKIVSGIFAFVLLVSELSTTNFDNSIFVKALSKTVDANVYANTYYKRYNSAYKDLSEYGDCANFVSQCLYTGGLKQKKNGSDKKSTKYWWYEGEEYSESWAGCNKLRVHLESTRDFDATGYTGKNRIYNTFSNCEAGDTLLMSCASISTLPEHSMFVGETGTNYYGYRYVVIYGHTNNAKYTISFKKNNDDKIISNIVDERGRSVGIDKFDNYKAFRLVKTSDA